ncbi:F-box domain, cyclin-like protein [Artemisia annua]|uniref:F-box domain, cyclin-like protein n=1 Tax=Artemisia annua TaxID=35608 RepID=A0A2U1KVH9_ARTAN|nr:F-box domain, cyclin-like protein [Artemisia annua]
MAELTSLPPEILSIILVMVAISSEGAKDIVKISATCKEFYKLAKQSCVLKVVKFQSFTFTPNYRRHRNPRGLLLQCARYGNLDALCIIGKALVKRDSRFWDMVLFCEDPVCEINGSLINPLEYARLVVKIFIRYGRCEDISKILWPLRDYMMAANAELAEYRALGTCRALSKMCSYEQRRFGIIAFFTKLAKKLNRAPLNDYLAEVMPPHNAAHRIEVIKIFDKLFPATSD